MVLIVLLVGIMLLTVKSCWNTSDFKAGAYPLWSSLLSRQGGDRAALALDAPLWMYCTPSCFGGSSWFPKILRQHHWNNIITMSYFPHTPSKDFRTKGFLVRSKRNQSNKWISVLRYDGYVGFAPEVRRVCVPFFTLLLQSLRFTAQLPFI